jgi:hypothetical protein
MSELIRGIDVAPSLQIILHNCIQTRDKVENIDRGLLFEKLFAEVDVLVKGFEITLRESRGTSTRSTSDIKKGERSTLLRCNDRFEGAIVEELFWAAIDFWSWLSFDFSIAFRGRKRRGRGEWVRGERKKIGSYRDLGCYQITTSLAPQSSPVPLEDILRQQWDKPVRGFVDLDPLA